MTVVHYLVKLFENGMPLKGGVKLISWNMNSAHGDPLMIIGEVC